MDIVTIFQGHHSQSNKGWFTTDTSRSCAEEIENCEELFFAYYVPNMFYFAEGGFGHHMKTLGNPPRLDDPVSLSLIFDDFKNTVVINGNYCFNDILEYLKGGGYLPYDISHLKVCATNPYREPYNILLTDPILRESLKVFEGTLPDSVTHIKIL